MKVCFETFGCRLNRAEALQMEAEYLAKGWELTTKHSDADLFVVRGCSVTRRAQHDCEKLIAHLRRHYRTVPIRICGCLNSETSTGLPSLAKAKTKAKAKGEGEEGKSPLTTRTHAVPDIIPTRTARAYLKCQDGCSGKCTFCIVPKFRGPSVSVPFDELIDRAKRFIDAGYREIVLTGCNLVLYASQGKHLPDLVAALAELTPPLQPSTSNLQPSTSNLQPSTSNLQPSTSNLQPSACRIRLGSLEPGACALETVNVMAEHENICRFLHIPVQSGSNAILAAMRRPYLIKDIEQLVKTAKQKMPLIGLGCDIMVGFPGETDVDFAATQGLYKRLAFSNAHVFPYSERPGTIAAGLPNAVPHEIRHQRAHLLADISRVYRIKAARNFIGKDVTMVVEDEQKLTGWTSEYFTCKITNKRSEMPKRKDLVKVHVMDAHDDRLKAILL